MQKADAIFVLGGSRTDRAFEAANLYREGYAPLIVMSRGGHEASELILARQGIQVPTEVDIMRDLLVTRLNIPASAVLVLEQDVDNTAAEGEAVSGLAQARHWTRIIAITGRSSTRRAGFALRRALGAGTAVVATCSRYDTYDASRWWQHRSSIRATMTELPKLLAYWLGLTS